jgi:hypothetical protein
MNFIHLLFCLPKIFRMALELDDETIFFLLRAKFKYISAYILHSLSFFLLKMLFTNVVYYIEFCTCILFPCHNSCIFEVCSYQMTLLVTWVNSAGTNLHFLVCGSLWRSVTFIRTLTRAMSLYYYHLQLKIYISRAWKIFGLCHDVVWGFWSSEMCNVSG